MAHPCHQALSSVKNDSMRIIAGRGRSVTVCGPDLSPLRTEEVPFEPHGAALDGLESPQGQDANSILRPWQTDIEAGQPGFNANFR